ncbi:MAG TPA: hypothetical protein VK756_06060 [Solirubrobacteraceae bacterium]|jgi:hypothetical protein|nr:hypothetical protein [Solirubrobacteraceae bacterium]
MRRVARTRFMPPTLALALGLSLLGSAAPAVAASHHARESHHARDVAATRAYVEANYRLVRAARANLAASQAAIRALARDTVAACPLAGEGSYANSAASQVSEEVIATIVVTAYQPDAAATHAFVGAIAHLRWSNQRLTRSVRRYVVKLEHLAVLPPANICEDVKAFAALDFRTAPPATLNYDKLYLAAQIEAEEVPLRLLAPYASAPQAALLRRIKQLEAPLAEAEAHAVSEWTKIMRGLALSE